MSTMLQMAVNSDHVPNGVGPGHTGQLCRELQAAGVESLLTLDSDGALAAGAMLVADAIAVRRSDGAAARFRQQAYDILAAGLPLSVSVHGLGEGTDAHAAFSAVSGPLRLAIDDAGASSGNVTIVVDADTLSPQAAWALRRERLNDGPVYMLADCCVMQVGHAPDERDRYEKFWSQLWHVHACDGVRAAFAPVVVPQCALLSAESARCVQASTGIQVPAGTAWLPLRLNIASFADGSGKLCEHAIEQALCRGVEIGDALHDLIRWPTAQLRHDAWQNRRLALELTGFGELVARRSQDPRQFSTLRELYELLGWIRDTLHRQSRVIARRSGYLPAFSESDPSRKFPHGRVRNGWRSRWLEAVEAAAVRHRNLLVLSPWSVFPGCGTADYRYADLLPLLGFANACAFGPAPSLAQWNISKFKCFHKRAWAVLQQRGATHQIAERP